MKKKLKILTGLLRTILIALLLIAIVNIIRIASDKNEHIPAGIWSTFLLAWAQFLISVLSNLAEKLISDKIEDIRKKFRKHRKRKKRSQR